MFRSYFSSSSTILVNDLNEFSYLTSIEDDEMMSKCEVIKAIHKTTFNKTLEINDVINCTLRQLIRIVLF
jgi:hypothetical protein